MCTMPKTFRQALLDHASRHSVSLAEVARGTGVSYEQLKKISQRDQARTNVHDALAVAAFFGLTVNEFLEDHLAQDRLAVADLWFRLTPEERDILQAAARGRAAQDPAVE
jgi:transcriptional regulator with XRE-family HTH domain